MGISKALEEKLKGKEAWVTSYNGHEIKVVNKLHVTMYIDGNEVAKQKGLLSSKVILQAVIPDTDKVIVAYVYQKSSADLIATCDFIIGDLIPAEYGFQHKDGTLVVLTDEEMKQYLQYRKEEDESAVFISTILN